MRFGPTLGSWKGELAASLIFPLEGCPISTWELTFLGKRVLVTAVRAKAIVRSSVLCSLDELCKTFLLKDTMLKILRKTSTKSGGLPFPQKGKACGAVGRESRAQNYNSAAKARAMPFKAHHILTDVLRKRQELRVTVSQSKRAPTPAGGASYCAPPLCEKVKPEGSCHKPRGHQDSASEPELLSRLTSIWRDGK